MSEKFSYSKLDTYKGCPFKFWLNYVQKNYAYSDSVATKFGTAIHETEEIIANLIKNGEEINYVQIKNNLIKKFTNIEHLFKDSYLTADNKSGRTYRQKAYEYLEQDIYNLEKFMKDHPTYKIIGTEQKFNFKFDDDHSFNGSIDRVFYDTATDRYIIQDIKSWAVPKDEDDLKTPLQMVVYTLAAKELWGCTEDQITCEYYLPLVNHGLIQQGGTKGYMTRGVKKINELFESIKNNDFKPKLSALCNYCAYCHTNPEADEKYKYLCPYYSLWNRETRDKFDRNKSEYTWEGLEKHEQIMEAFRKKYNVSTETQKTNS